jgi:hypothetical protein
MSNLICNVCEQPLGHEPKLGEYIMHPVCRDNLMRFIRKSNRMKELHPVQGYSADAGVVLEAVIDDIEMLRQRRRR